MIRSTVAGGTGGIFSAFSPCVGVWGMTRCRRDGYSTVVIVSLLSVYPSPKYYTVRVQLAAAQPSLSVLVTNFSVSDHPRDIGGHFYGSRGVRFLEGSFVIARFPL